MRHLNFIASKGHIQIRYACSQPPIFPHLIRAEIQFRLFMWRVNPNTKIRHIMASYNRWMALQKHTHTKRGGARTYKKNKMFAPPTSTFPCGTCTKQTFYSPIKSASFLCSMLSIPCSTGRISFTDTYIIHIGYIKYTYALLQLTANFLPLILCNLDYFVFTLDL